MTFPKALTPKVDRSTLSTGEEVYTAYLDELPGAVCEGRSREEALSELLAILDSIRERLGLKELGLRTPTVPSWKWEIFEGARLAASIQADPIAGEEFRVELPEGFRVPA